MPRKPKAPAAEPQPDPQQPEAAEQPDAVTPADQADPEPEPEAEPTKPATRSTGNTVPQGGGTETSPFALALLAKACDLFGLDPGRDVRPKQLLSWKHYPGNALEDVPASVVIVTAGGVKLRMFDDGSLDEDSEATLRRIFGAWATDPKTKEVMPLPLPDDLTLPVQAVTGLVASTDHRYPGGYLKSGGRSEANRRDAAERKQRRQR